VEAEVKAIGGLSLELDDGFVLNLRHDLFMPSLRSNVVNEICETSLETNKQGTKRKRNNRESSSKLWHCRLGHISRGLNA
jgi:hypothetical protein